MRLAALVLFLFSAAAGAQSTVDGRVVDARTGVGLPAATVQVAGTNRGTVTNADGAFRIAVPATGDTLVVRFLGYETARRAVPASGRIEIALAPVVATLGEAVVTAGNPAESLMRRVIARKARWRAGLATWRAEVYSRQTLRADSVVVAVIEGQTVAYWDRERGLREVVQATRRTGNLGGLPADAFAAAEQILNLSDDDIPFGGYDLMGPTHPRALSFYRFEIVGRRAVGADLVVDLAFRPKNPLQPGLTGTLAVLPETDALLAVSARPSGAVQFPLVTQFDLTLEQQFASFGQAVGGEPVWLPVDFRLAATARAGNALLRFPGIGFAVSSRLTDFEVNVAVPDSLFERDGVAVDSARVAAGLTVDGIVPLSADEQRALAEIDSTRSLAEAYQPTGPLARFVQFEVNDGGARGDSTSRRSGVSASPEVRYNRVEGAYLGAEAGLRVGRARLAAAGGYQTGPSSVAGSLSASVRLSRRVAVGAGVFSGAEALGRSVWITPGMNTLASLVLGEDAFDYAQRTGGAVTADWAGRRPARPRARLSARYDSYSFTSPRASWALLGSLPPGNVQASFDEIARGGLRLRIGDWTDGVGSGVVGQRGATVWLEGGRRWRGLPPQQVSDYGRVEGEVRWFVETGLRRRLLPPTLHLRLAAGTATAGMPVERSFGIDTPLAGVSAFGALRARGGRMVLARRYALVAWEQDLRSLPFELLGWRRAAPRGVSMQVHGAHAWALGAPGIGHVEPSVVHHEVGASVGFGYTAPVRLDVTYRLTDSPGVVVGVGVARLF